MFVQPKTYSVLSGETVDTIMRLGVESDQLCGTYNDLKHAGLRNIIRENVQKCVYGHFYNGREDLVQKLISELGAMPASPTYEMCNPHVFANTILREDVFFGKTYMKKASEKLSFTIPDTERSSGQDIDSDSDE